MPIHPHSPVRVFAQEDFHCVARQVLGIAFAIHNAYGRLLDEVLFKRLFAARSVAQDMAPVEAEVRIRVTHADFAKDYIVDLLIGRGLPLEVKAAETLAPAHRAQVLHYTLMAGLHHALLINLRSHRAQHEYISTTLDETARKRFQFADLGWRELDADSAGLKRIVLDLLADWGAFLEVALYREAVIHFLGGAARVCRPVEVLDGGEPVGTQKVCLLNPETAFTCTAITRGWEQMREHQRRFLAPTRLRAVSGSTSVTPTSSSPPSPARNRQND